MSIITHQYTSKITNYYIKDFVRILNIDGKSYYAEPSNIPNSKQSGDFFT